MRPTKSEVHSQFKEIFEQKLLSWDEKNPPPTPPTVQDIRKDLFGGRFRLVARCGCKLGNKISYTYRAPEIADVLSAGLIRPTSVEVFLKTAERYYKRRARYRAVLQTVKSEAINEVLYGKANFSEALDKLRTVRDRKK